MAESFENLDDILRDWAVEKVQKSLTEALNRFAGEAGKGKIKPFLLENDQFRKNTRAFSVHQD